jgi:hypothetical protein
MLASLENGLALKVRDLVSGASMPVSLANYDPGSSSWKTSQGCLISGWEPFSETWPRSGTMRRGIAYPLPPLAPIIGETVSGLLPTPTTSEHTGPGHAAQGGMNLRTFVASFPTPTAKANMMAPSMQKWAAHRNLWPTPTSSLGTKGGRITPQKSREGGTLIEAVSARAFATPTSSPWKSGKASQATHERNSRPLSEQIGGSLNPTWVEWLMGFPLEWTALKDWATPSSRKSRS